MKVVYFDRELTDRAPELIGTFCLAPDVTWVGLTEIMLALDRGEAVEIRPASETERERAASLAVIGGIAEELTAAHNAGQAGHPCSASERRLCENISVLRGIGLQLATPLLGLLDSSIPVASANVGSAVL